MKNEWVHILQIPEEWKDGRSVMIQYEFPDNRPSIEHTCRWDVYHKTWFNIDLHSYSIPHGSRPISVRLAKFGKTRPFYKIVATGYVYRHTGLPYGDEVEFSLDGIWWHFETKKEKNSDTVYDDLYHICTTIKWDVQKVAVYMLVDQDPKCPSFSIAEAQYIRLDVKLRKSSHL